MKNCSKKTPCALNSCLACLKSRLKEETTTRTKAEAERDYWNQSAINAERSYQSAITDSVAYRAALEFYSDATNYSKQSDGGNKSEILLDNGSRGAAVLKINLSGVEILDVCNAAQQAAKYNDWKFRPTRAMSHTTINNLLTALNKIKNWQK